MFNAKMAPLCACPFLRAYQLCRLLGQRPCDRHSAIPSSDEAKLSHVKGQTALSPQKMPIKVLILSVSDCRVYRVDQVKTRP